MRVAIHQPNFLPWAGYFYKLILSDVFVFLDTVQFPRGKSYCSRVLVKASEGARWLTVPVTGRGDMLPVKDIQISGTAWIKKHIGTLTACYGKAPFFQDYFPMLKKEYDSCINYLADFNIRLVKQLAHALEARARLVRASELGIDRLDTGELLVAIVKKLGGNAYITGRGAGTARHLDRDKFLRSGIRVEEYEYSYPRYEQLWGEFVPGMSVVDVLFNTGPRARGLILSGGKRVYE